MPEKQGHCHFFVEGYSVVPFIMSYFGALRITTSTTRITHKCNIQPNSNTSVVKYQMPARAFLTQYISHKRKRQLKYKRLDGSERRLQNPSDATYLNFTG